MRKHILMATLAGCCIGALATANAQQQDDSFAPPSDDGTQASQPGVDSDGTEPPPDQPFDIWRMPAGSYQLQQPMAGTYQLQQPMAGTYQLQQPMAGTYQLQQPMAGTFQLQQPMAGTYQLQQPMAGTFQLHQPVR